MALLCSLLDFPDLVVLIALATGLHRRVPSIAGGASSSLVLRLRQLSKSWLDFVEQGDGALRSALVRVLEQTLQRRELADAHLLRELQICKDKLPEDGKACSFCSSTPGSTDVPARCAHQDRDRDTDLVLVDPYGGERPLRAGGAPSGTARRGEPLLHRH